MRVNTELNSSTPIWEMYVWKRRLDMNTFPNCSMEKAIWFHCYVVCIQSQCLWFSEYNFCRDSKENNKANTLDTFYIPGEVICAQSVGFAYKVSREKKHFFFFSNSWWNDIISKAEWGEILHKCHHPTFQLPGKNLCELYFFCLTTPANLTPLNYL